MIQEGFLEEGLPKLSPGEEQEVDRWLGEWRAFGQRKEVQGSVVVE